MKEIMSFFEDLDEVVYITNMDTDEVVYMNKKLREEHGGLPLKAYVGRKCYELFQRSAVPCKFCTNHKLERGKFVEWQYYNPLHDKRYMIKDGMLVRDGKRYRLEIALDITTPTAQKSMFSEYQNVEGIVNEGFRLALEEDIPDNSIMVILEYIGKALNGDRSYVFELNEDGSSSNTYEWTRCGVTSEKDNLQNMSLETCAEWVRHFRDKRNIIIEDLETVKEIFPNEYEVLKPQNIHSLVEIPLYRGKKLIGFYGVDNPSGIPMDYAVNMLQIVASFLVSTIRRRALYNRLYRKSNTDCLTELGNRYELNEHVERMKKKEDLGVIFCDITGLKRTNDEEGHEAGDRLLVRAANSLREVFGGHAIFRTGGDEFLVLCAGVEQPWLQERAAELKKKMGDQGVIAAIGLAWQSGINMTEVEQLISKAENDMYTDKAAYYRQNGIDRRR